MLSQAPFLNLSIFNHRTAVNSYKRGFVEKRSIEVKQID
jgi:hypothetical protein